MVIRLLTNSPLNCAHALFGWKGKGSQPGQLLCNNRDMQAMLEHAKKLTIPLILTSFVALAGCTSTSSSVSGYAGPSVSSAVAKRNTAKSDVKEAKASVRDAEKAIRKIERSMARAERRLKRKRISEKQKSAAEKTIKEGKRELRSAKRTLRRAERSLSRAERREKAATKAIATAKRRKAEAERRIAEAKKRKEIEAARKQLEKENDTGNSRLRRRLFAINDPALKFVDDYRARKDGGFEVAAIPVDKMDKRLYRQQVSYRTRHKVGTIVVDTKQKYLFLVQPNGKAMRYGIGVGRQGFAWSGSAHIGWKQQWPKWTPPAEMIARRPSLAKWGAENGGMPGGPKNPLGARALYLMKDGKDTLYRLHGTPQWNSIGTAASSGCIRLMNQDVIDLYKRVPHGTKVVVL